MRKSIEISQELYSRMEAFQAESNDEARVKIAEEIRSLTEELNKARSVEQAERAIAARAAAQQTPEQKEVRRYSIVKAIREAVNGNLTGLEAEMSQEAEKELQRSGQSMKGFGIPSVVLRAINAQNATEADYGAALKTTTEGGYIAALKNELLASKLGVQFMDDLVGNVHFAKGGNFKASWIAEGAEASVQKVKYSSVNMTPHGLQAIGAVTYDLLNQSSYSVEDYVWRELREAHAQELDRAIFFGSGTGAEPTGVAKTSGVAAVAITKTPTYAQLVAMKTAIAAKNGVTGKLNFVSNASVAGLLQTTPIVANYPSFLLTDGKVAGYDLHESNGIEDNKVILGDFSNVIVGSWGAMDIIVDPYSKKAQRLVEVTPVSYHDIAVIRPESFCVGTVATA